MVSSSSVQIGWAKSLVGRDWEIFWSEEEENDTGDADADADDADTSDQADTAVDMEVDSNDDGNGNDENKKPGSANENENENDNNDDSQSEGSIIDDWYAGHVLSLVDDSPNEDGKWVFKVRFVGEDDIYDMVLEPSKVRPSARGWIKRTKALLCGGDVDHLPPDTSMMDDRLPLNNLQMEVDSYDCGIFQVPEHKEGVQPPRVEDVQKILKFRYLLRAQLVLRSRLSTIVNHHGSTKYVDGEPNPTESYVEHLAQCCQDMDLVCSWYLRCWELLVRLFGESESTSLSTETSPDGNLTVDKMFHEYLEYGKISLVNCGTMDVSPTATKRRLLSSETSSSRRPQRRRKISRWGTGTSSDGIDIVADECDLRVTSSVDMFVKSVRECTERWFQSVFANMLQAISHFVVEPVIRWQRRSKQLIGETNEILKELATDDAGSTTSSADGDDGDGQQSSDEESEKEELFSLEEVQSCYDETQANPVLATLDLGGDVEKLKKKIADITMAAAHAAHLLKCLAKDADAKSKSEDSILVGLKSILDAARQPGDSLFNVERIGDSESPLTRELLSNALDFRNWVLDVRHARRVRERCSFVKDLAAKSANLPDISSGKDMLDHSEITRATEEAKLETQKMLEDLTKTSDLIDTYTRELDLGNGSQTLMSIDGVKTAMGELSKCSALSLVEEKLAVRADLLDWSAEAKTVCENGGEGWLEYSQLEQLSKSLHSIFKGRSPRRIQLLQHSETDPETDSTISAFASDDALSVCGSVVEQVTRLHAKASEWKERADAIILALRAHGNASAGEIAQLPKLPAMVDIKRIKDLLDEYSTIKVDQTGVKPILEQVCNEANTWSSSLVRTIADDEYPLDKCLSFLECQRDSRPKGIIMDPTRTVFDAVLDSLVWQNRVKEALDEFSKVCNPEITNTTSIEAEEVSSLLANAFYPLLAEGIEALEGYTEKAVAEGICSPTSIETQQSLSVLEHLHGVRRSARAISKDRLESHPLGATILDRIVNPVGDIAQGCPLFATLWVQWHVAATQLIDECGGISDDENDVDHEPPSVRRSLSEANELYAQQPALRSDTGSPLALQSLVSAKSLEIVRLETLIRDAEKEESEIRDLLQKSKEMLKGSIHKADCVRNHLVQLKESQIIVKDRSLGDGGLALASSFEPQLDHHIKVFTWLVRTFAYPWLHLDEASFSFSNDSVESSERIPFGILVSLYDRMPCEVEKQAGDFALISLRIRELYDAAKKWQDEITRNTTISFRGGKTRRAAGSPGAVAEPDQEASSKLQMEHMKKLAENPILTKVAMPRESAVNGILESSSQFEVELQNFLGNDYGGYSPDRAPYPGKNSLVGENGEFILYRLTGSPLFSALQSSLHTLSNVGGDVLAETPGKATFDWIKASVAWIERLAEAITCESPFESVNGNILVVPAQEAREILKEAENIFLTIPEDLKRTLSKHGIFVTTNRQDKTIRVILKKSGAHHSIGGTVIRWCPILFECLKADISRLDGWERALTEILADFNAFFSATRDHSKSNTKNLYQWYCYREQVHGLLLEGQESLVISPQKGLVCSFQNLLSSINNYLRKHCKPELEKEFAKKWFAQSSSLVDDRFLLLESLLYRTAAAEGHQFPETSNSPHGLEPARNFRDACRSYVEKSLSKAANAVGMENISDSNEDGDIKSYCAIIAWDVEREMFERFQGELGVSRVSDEYRNKARSLRCSLEDKNNLSLCLRVLTGDVDASKLVSMSSEDLASEKAKMKRARAEKEAKFHANLTPQLKKQKTDKNTDVDMVKSGNSQESSPIRPEKPGSTKNNQTPGKHAAGVGLKSVLRVSKHVPHTPEEKAAKDEATPPGSSGDAESTTSSATSTSKDIEMDESSPAAIKALLKASRKARPPPPPSLAKSFQVDSNSSPPPTNRGVRVVSNTEGDSFLIEIGNPRSSFLAAFYLEDESMDGVNSFLPGTLSERGRLRSEEFYRFLRDKLAGGRWLAIRLRLATMTDEDAKEYKKFYKEYEMRNRIAMFSVGQNSKLFLVTPKFHESARAAGIDALPNRSSTYAIVLTKEIMMP